ncbi:CBR1 [Scenedesmus sp. PABB004]|nr:CBR1 [Scenedesmus sp. PABB004]
MHGKKRRAEVDLDAERSMYSSFVAAANSVSQLYTQGVQQQRRAAAAASRATLEKVLSFVLRENAGGEHLSKAALLAFLQHEYENANGQDVVAPQPAMQFLPFGGPAAAAAAAAGSEDSSDMQPKQLSRQAASPGLRGRMAGLEHQHASHQQHDQQHEQQHPHLQQQHHQLHAQAAADAMQARRRAFRSRSLSHRVSIYAKKLVGEQDAFAVEIKSLQANVSAMRKAALAAKGAAEQQQMLDALDEASATINGMGPGGDLRRMCAPKVPRLLSYLLGDRTNLVSIRKDQAVGIREEYHAFRNRAVVIMGTVPMALYLGMKRADALHLAHHGTHPAPPPRLGLGAHAHVSLTPALLTGLQAYFAWLCYFYVAMALRECVLLVNGSHIRAWWISHHMWSALGSLLMLSLPISSPTVYYFAESFMLWSTFQAGVMLVQNRYQRRRMYTRIALGKNSAMDVVSGESSGSAGQLLLLYPLLFALQGWQLFIGLDLALKTWPALVDSEGWLEAERCQSDLRGMRGTFVCGCIFSFLAVMNAANTIATITEKRGRQPKPRKGGGATGGGGAAAAAGKAIAAGAAGMATAAGLSGTPGKKTPPKKAREAAEATREPALLAKAARIAEQLAGLYPSPPIPLDHGSTFQLLVAVVLSAQTTDKKVNEVTPTLFAAAPDAAAMAALEVAAIQTIIAPIGLAPTKARNLSNLSKLLLERHGGAVPGSFAELEALPGVGHKTASVIMSQAFGHSAFPVDTHIHRLAQRWGLSSGASVEQTEADLKALLPPAAWRDAHLQIIYFGREHCPAQRHDPAACPICSWAAAPGGGEAGGGPAAAAAAAASPAVPAGKPRAGAKRKTDSAAAKPAAAAAASPAVPAGKPRAGSACISSRAMELDAVLELVRANLPLVVAVGVVLLSVLALALRPGAKPFLSAAEFKAARLVRIDQLTHNTKRFVFELEHPKQRLGLPTGQHITFLTKGADGKDVYRPYTPVTDDDTLGRVEFVIKVYPGGKMTQALDAMAVGDTMAMKGPRGRFTYARNMKRAIGMVAGGTGVTPMYQVAAAILKDPSDRTELRLIFANVSEDDILIRGELDALAAAHPGRFSVFYVLNTPPPGWAGGAGFVSKAMIVQHLPAPGRDVMVLSCGPKPMVDAMKAHFDDLGHAEDAQFHGAPAVLAPRAAHAAAEPAPRLTAEQTYEAQLAQHHQRAAPKSSLPTRGEAAALRLLLDPDLFTPEAWAGMLKLEAYARYVESLCDAEAAPGCEACTANRLVLEKAWQTVSAEFYDPSGRFSQSAWAQQLLTVLRAHGGVLRSRPETFAALGELVGSLGDRYSAFLEPSAFRRALRRPLPAERAYLAAQYVGVGLQLGGLAPQGGGRVVEAPLVESPAEGAGIRRGDRLLDIEGIPSESLTLDEATTLLRGPAGSTVSLTVAPGGRGGAPRQLELERRPLPQPAVKVRPPPPGAGGGAARRAPVAAAAAADAGAAALRACLQETQLRLPDGRVVECVRLHYFSHDATTALAGIIAAAEAEGRVAGYVIDLRNDPGGVFEEAVAIASLFEDPTRAVAQTVRSSSGLVDVVWRPSGLAPSAWPDVMAGPLTSKPLVLLVNANTASASEVLAGALRDYGRATLIGETTFGKGLVQYYFPMGEGLGGLKLTVAKYLTPHAYDISRQGGLVPDVPCNDYPHGVFTPGTADRCVVEALGVIADAQPADPLSFSPLLASAGDKPSP